MNFNDTFNCSGKVNFHDWRLMTTNFLMRGELDNILFLDTEHSFSDSYVNLFDSILPVSTVMLNLNHFHNCIEMKLKILCRYENYSHILHSSNSNYIDYFSIRSRICEFILYVRKYMNSIKWDYYALKIINPDIEEDLHALFLCIRRFFSRLKNIPGSTFHYVASNLGNKCTQPEFHLYHIHLELRWFYITIIYMKNIQYHYSQESTMDDIENVHRLVVNDLIYICLKVFERIPVADMCQKTPYNCTCFRELWLMIQIFIDELSIRIGLKSFWDHVNFSLNIILNENKSTENMVYWQESMECSLPVCKSPELFCIWIIYHFTLLYGYSNSGVYMNSNCLRIRSNYEQVEKILKAYVSKGGKDGERDEIDEELRVMIPLLRILITDWWPSKTSIVSLLWDCFHKRLSQPFLLQTSGPWSLSAEKKTPMDMLKHVKDRIDGNFEEAKESSYGMFLRLLGSSLRKNYNSNNTKYWNQIKGRVYSKFSKNKIQEFSETGLYNFFSLFFTLAIAADTLNVCSVMLDLLPAVHEFSNENAKKCSLIWKGKLVVLLLFNEFGLSFTTIANGFTETANVISCRKDETSRSMMANFVDVLDIIFSSNTKLESSEYLFIGGWIDRYLLECPKNRVRFVVKILSHLFEKCRLLKLCNNNLDGVSKMLEALWSNVACRVRQLVFDPILTGDYYHDLSQLAVAFTVGALDEPLIAKKHKHSAASLFQHFAASLMIKDIRITRYYLMLLLQNEETVNNLKKEFKNFDLVLIQAWIRCSILGYDSNWSEIHVLQNYIYQIEEIKGITIFSNEYCTTSTNNREMILSFMMCLSKKQKFLKTDQERIQYAARCRLYFNNIDKWILLPLSEEFQETELALWIYRCIGTLILSCATVFYVKNQANNILKILINKVALPPEHSSQLYVRNMGKKIFSMLLLGLENLNAKSDITIQALIKNLFDQYIPLLITEANNGNFKVSDILLKCFQDASGNFARFLLEVLMTNFFIVSSDHSMHKHSHLVSMLLNTLLKGGRSYGEHIIEGIITVCTNRIVNCYMKIHDHHPHKRHTVDLISNIITNCYFKENNLMRQKLIDLLYNIVQIYLTTYPQPTFELLHSIASLKVEMIRDLFPQIQSMVEDLERYKRPNAASIRYLWNQFQNFVQSLKDRF